MSDDAGRQHRFPSQPERIVSLVPSATSIVVALGAGALLVGRTDFDTDPAVADLPSVGGGLEPDMEVLLSLRPDLVFRFAGPSDPLTPRRLDEAGVPHFAVRPDGIDDVRRVIGAIGQATATVPAAESLLTRLDVELAEVRAATSGLEPIRVAYVLGGSPPWVSGPGTFIEELLELAGGVNVFSDLERVYAPVSVEDLVDRDLDLVLSPRGADLPRDALRAVPIRELDPSVEIPGPELGRAARAVAAAIRPDLYR